MAAIAGPPTRSKRRRGSISRPRMLPLRRTAAIVRCFPAPVRNQRGFTAVPRDDLPQRLAWRCWRTIIGRGGAYPVGRADPIRRVDGVHVFFAEIGRDSDDGAVG